MNIPRIPFIPISWDTPGAEVSPGATGTATQRISEHNGFRLRMVEYSPGYDADHFCKKGHMVLVVSGSVTITLEDGRSFNLPAGSSFIVGDDIDAHHAKSEIGARVFIVD